MNPEQFEDHAFDLDSFEGGQRLGRRQFLLAGLATGAAATALPNYAAIARKRRTPLAKHGTFPMGVASGAPAPKGTVLWTKLGEIERNSRLHLEVAKDAKFRKVVFEKEVTAKKAHDFTVRTKVKGLKPHREYFYRFRLKHGSSPVGRFRTAPPAGSQERVRIAVLSCQNYETGFYNAMRAIANEDVDLVVHLGDYIYESSYGRPADKVRTDTTGFNADATVQYLDEFRQKYALYKADPDLQAMHAAHNFVIVWDDHEVEDNYADGLPSSKAKSGLTNNGKTRSISFTEREANGYQAFFDYQPLIRMPGDSNRIYQSIRLGGLVELILTDQRQYRSQQPCNDSVVAPCPDEMNPARTMLGPVQKEWFKTTLANSPQTWKLWGSELMVMGFQSNPGQGILQDTWDGYAFERKDLLEYIRANGISNTVSLAGDVHSFFVGTATTDGSDGAPPVIPEFVAGAATSPGLPEETGASEQTINNIIKAADKHISFSDLKHKGYGIVEVAPGYLTCEYKTVQVAAPDGGQASTLGKWALLPGQVKPSQIA